MEILAGACCSTWFVQTQHHTPVQILAQSELPVREGLLGPLPRGELMSGVAVNSTLMRSSCGSS